MKDRPAPSYGAVYVPPHQRLRSGITSTHSHSLVSSLSHFQTEKQLNTKTNINSNIDRTNNKYNNFSINDNIKKNLQYNSAYSDGVSDEDSDRELETSFQPVSVRLKKAFEFYEKFRVGDIFGRL